MDAALKAASKKLRPTKTKIMRTPQYYEQKEKLRKANPELFEELYGDEVSVSPIKAIPPKRLQRLVAPVTEAHGLMGDKSWSFPKQVVVCDQDARPGYATRKAHEYVDEPEVLDAKVDMLAKLIKKAKHFVTYTGAGISTASGIGDYASKSKASVAVGSRCKLQNPLAAVPTFAHKTLTALYHGGHLKHWVQQNHDGLPQKAGFPQHCLNEIHGAWHDPSNPVVPMSGSLRSDLMTWLVDWEERTDFCLAMGTSLCGMNADRMVTTPANTFIEGKKGLGACIISLQQTDLDSIASLRIFAKIDDVMRLLVNKMALSVPERPAMYDWPAHRNPKAVLAEDVFQVPYDDAGELTQDRSKWRPWNLQVGAKVRLTSGPGKGYLGTVVGKSDLGNYAVELPCTREGSASKGKKRVHYALGPWWVNTAIQGEWPRLPLVNVGEQTWSKDSDESKKLPPVGASIERLWHDGQWYACSVARKMGGHVVLWYPDTSEREQTPMAALTGKWRFRTPPLGASIERLWHDGEWYPCVVRAYDGVTLSLFYGLTNEVEQVTTTALQGQWRRPKAVAGVTAVSVESVSAGKAEEIAGDDDEEDLMNTD